VNELKLGVDRDPTLGKRRAISVVPLDEIGTMCRPKERNALMPEAQEMLHDGPGASRVVTANPSGLNWSGAGERHLNSDL